MTGVQRLGRRVLHLAGAVSVRNKILGIVLALVIALGAATTMQARRALAATMQRELRDRGASMVSDLAARSVDLVLVHDLYAAHELLRDTVSYNRDVTYAFLVDESGTVIAHSFEGGFPAALVDVNVASPTDRYQALRLATNEGPVWDFAAPVFDGRAGTARVGLSEHSMHNAVVAVTGQLALTTLLVSSVSVLAALLVTWLITRPIEDLVGVTRAVARGDRAAKARVWANDEVGQLTSAFNAMMEELSGARRALEAHNADLQASNRELARLNEVVLEKEAARSMLLERIMAAQEEERRRISRELHDETSQALTSLKLGLRVLERPQGNEAIERQLEAMRGIVDRTLDALHDLALDLRPSVLDDMGLVAALERYGRECHRRFGLAVEVRALSSEMRRLPPPVETAFYRIAQEALANVARHASASRAEVVLDCRSTTVRMVVEDDGVGFDVGAAGHERRLGLYGMRERADLLGGALRVESSPGRGTTVIVVVPLSESAG